MSHAFGTSLIITYTASIDVDPMQHASHGASGISGYDADQTTLFTILNHGPSAIRVFAFPDFLAQSIVEPGHTLKLTCKTIHMGLERSTSNTECAVAHILAEQGLPTSLAHLAPPLPNSNGAAIPRTPHWVVDTPLMPSDVQQFGTYLSSLTADLKRIRPSHPDQSRAAMTIDAFLNCAAALTFVLPRLTEELTRLHTLGLIDESKPDASDETPTS